MKDTLKFVILNIDSCYIKRDPSMTQQSSVFMGNNNHKSMNDRVLEKIKHQFKANKI
jgi:hypothetical protein